MQARRQRGVERGAVVGLGRDQRQLGRRAHVVGKAFEPRCQCRITVEQRAPFPAALSVAAQIGFPDWMEVDEKGLKGKFKAVPEREQMLPDINENLVVELYSK